MLGVIYTRSSRIMNDVFYDDSTMISYYHIIHESYCMHVVLYARASSLN
jgi:hypothetical protein